MKDEVKAITLLVVLIALAAGACRRPAIDDVTPAREMRQVTDDLGRTVLVPVKITRVVSTAPSITEMVFAAGGGDRLVGVTTFCNYPEEARSIAKIGDTMTPNMEAIVALEPDIVFVSTASQLETFAKTLEQNEIAVYVTNPASLDDVYRNLLVFGDIFDTRQQTEMLVSKLSGEVQMLTHLVSFAAGRQREEQVPVRTFVQISKEPLFTIGKDAFLTDLLAKAYGVSATKDIATAFPKLSKETALALRPEVIILSDSPDNQEPNEAFRNSPAVKNGRVYKVNADILSRPGPRLVDALEQIARLLHPDKF